MRYQSNAPHFATAAYALFAFAWGGLAPSNADALDVRADLSLASRFAEFRTVVLDSLPVSELVTHPDGRVTTPDGYAVRIRPGREFATYFRRGDALEGGPFSATFETAAWGFGVQGLSVRSTVRLLDNWGSDPWPGTEPEARFLEGFVEWTRSRFTARGGRLHEANRLGTLGFDGAWSAVRLLDRRLTAHAYGGWGLAQGDDLPVTDAALDPLNEFLPERRQHVGGFGASWRTPRLQSTFVYQREVDPRAKDFVSERAGGTAIVQIASQLAMSGGVDYDLALDDWGRADASLQGHWGPAVLEVGARRMRPFFPLWTIWGAFSPVPYTAYNARGSVDLGERWQLYARGERFTFDDPGASTPLVVAEDEGFRAAAGASGRWGTKWSGRAELSEEFGPGAASLGSEADLTYRPLLKLSATVLGSWTRRPLEFRFDQAKVTTWGLRMNWSPGERWRAAIDVRHLDESRERDDAAAFDASSWRVAITSGWTFETGAPDRVPPAVLRIPEISR